MDNENVCRHSLLCPSHSYQHFLVWAKIASNLDNLGQILSQEDDIYPLFQRHAHSIQRVTGFLTFLRYVSDVFRPIHDHFRRGKHDTDDVSIMFRGLILAKLAACEDAKYSIILVPNKAYSGSPGPSVKRRDCSNSTCWTVQVCLQNSEQLCTGQWWRITQVSTSTRSYSCTEHQTSQKRRGDASSRLVGQKKVRMYSELYH